MQRSTRRITTRLLAVGTAGLILLAGCGGSDSNTNSASPAAAPGASSGYPAAAPSEAAPSEAAPSEAAPVPEQSSAAPEAAQAAAPAPSGNQPTSNPGPTALTASRDAKAAPAAGSKAPAGTSTAAAPSKAAAGQTAPGAGATPPPAGTPGAPSPAPGAAQGGGATDIGVTPTEVKFGGIYMYGWPLGDVIIQPMVREQRAIAKLVNDTGGIAGRKLTYVDCDDGFPDSARTRACYKKLVEQDKIFAFMGGCTFNEDQFQADMQRDKIPYFSPCSLYHVEWENPFSFPIHMDMQQEAAGTVGWLTGPGKKKPATYGLLCLDIPDSQAACGIVEKGMAAAGVKQVFKRTFRTGTPDMSSDIIAARTANPDIIVHYTIDPSVTARWMIDSAQQDYWPPRGMVGNHMTTEIIGSLIGDYPAKAPGGYHTQTSYLLWGSDYITWQHKYVPNNKGLSLHITQGAWFGSNVAVECMRRVGANLTRAAMMQCVKSQRWETGPGLAQAFQWAPGQRYAAKTGNTLEYMYKYVNKETYAKSDGTGKTTGFIPDPEGFEVIAPAR
jgi:Periplasmic binding protein